MSNNKGVYEFEQKVDNWAKELAVYDYKIDDLQPNTYSENSMTCECCHYYHHGAGLRCVDCKSHKKKCRPLQYHTDRHEVVCYQHGARKARYKGNDLYTCAEDGHDITVLLVHI